MFNSNIWPNCSFTIYFKALKCQWPWIWPFNFNGHSKANVSFDSPYMLSYLCLIVNIWPNCAPLQDIRLRNLSDLEFAFQGHSRSNMMMSLDLPYMVSYWHICSNYMSNSHHLALTATQTVFFYMYFLLLSPNYKISQVHSMTSKWPWRLKGQRHPLYV